MTLTKPTYVFTNGCFDLLHAGHVSILKFCREKAGPDGYVHVGLNSDESIRKIKGASRPIIPEEERKYILLALDCVDRVSIFNEKTPYKLIKLIKPDVIVKGPDYLTARELIVGSDLTRVEVAESTEYCNVSTSNIIRTVLKKVGRR